MKWLRLYASLPDSLKVGTLSDGSFRLYIELQCLACQQGQNGRCGVTSQSINWRLRRDVTVHVAPLLEVGLLRQNKDGEYVIPDWDTRQLPSDSSAERTRQYRQRNKELQRCDVTTTVTSDTLARHGDALDKSREEKKRKEKALPTASADRFESFWSAWPNSRRKVDKKDCQAKWKRCKFDEIADQIIADVEVRKLSKQWRDGYEPAPMTYLNGERWNDPIPPDISEPEEQETWS